MKNIRTRGCLSAFLALAMIFTVIFTVNLPTSAANYVANWGTRGEDCTSLSSYAEGFYTGIYVFEDMSKTKGGTGQSDAYQSALYLELQTLMKSKHHTETSYGGTRDLYKYTDCEKGDTSKISSFYSGTAIGPDWDSGATWNREHTWPNSKGLGGNDENDIMMLRPTWVQENSDRGNAAYGINYYDPNTESGGKYDLHGDVARIALYVYTRWGNTSNMWGSSGVIESLEVLLEWMESDPVDTWEMGRNDAVQSITGTRNVFVDYPEYAWLLFGEDVPADLVSPSGNKGAVGGDNSSEAETSQGGNQGGNQGGTTTSPAEMSIADALASADGTKMTVTGTVSKTEAWNEKYGDMNATISDRNGNEIYLYRVKTKVAVGDNITVTGTRATYNGLKEIKDITNITVNGTTGDNSGSTGDNTGDTTTIKGTKYTFSDYAPGAQYAANEVHKLDDTLTVTTNDAHFTTQLRLYHSDNAQYGARHATAVFKSSKAIKGIGLNAGNKDDILKISGSNDGSTWTLIDEVSVTASYADHNVDMGSAEYTYIKLESTKAQIRVQSITFEYVELSGTPDDGDNEESTTSSQSGETQETAERPSAETTENAEETSYSSDNEKSEDRKTEEPSEDEVKETDGGEDLPTETGCGASASGLAVIITISLAGLVICRKRDE